MTPPDTRWMDNCGLMYGRRDDSRWVDPTRTRTREEWPYTYDEFFLFGNRESVRGASGDYSDRLWQWDYKKADSLWKEHCAGCRWNNAGSNRIEKFMRAYHGRDLKVVGVAEGCNPSNGYPYWIVWWKPVESEQS